MTRSVGQGDCNRRRGNRGWTALEYRFFKCASQGRSFVTDLPLEGQHGHIDRVFNDDKYCLTTCMYIEAGLNFAKMGMVKFENSSDFDGESKMQYGADILRSILQELAKRSRPLRSK
ncbi:hypothetical protein BGX33_005715 [Mortierella sp. NVP41]|nr:hypothetical protein BGX33_005715 [Mortierella sp. NVP41]